MAEVTHPDTAVGTLPLSVRTAAALLFIYAVFVIANASYWQIASGWEDASDYPRGVIRFAGVTLIAIGLLRRQRWAWWLGVLLPLLLIALFVLNIAVILRAGGTGGLLGFAGSLTGPIVIAACPIMAMTLLLLPASRAAFRSSSS